MTIQRIFSHSVILSCFAINAIAKTDVSSVITIHEEEAISADVKDSEKTIANQSSCQNQFAKKQSESLFLSASIAIEVVNYCLNLNSFLHPETPKRFHYLENTNMTRALEEYNRITEKILKVNPKINQNKISECAKYKLLDHEKTLKKFFGSVPVDMRISFLNTTVKDVSRLCYRSYDELVDLRVKLHQQDFLKN